MNGRRGKRNGTPLVVAAADAEGPTALPGRPERVEIEGEGPLSYFEAVDEPTGKLETLRFGTDPQIENAVTNILEAIGEDPEREGLKKTPSRVAKAYAELTGG